MIQYKLVYVFLHMHIIFIKRSDNLWRLLFVDENTKLLLILKNCTVQKISH